MRTKAGALVAMAADLLALTLITPPGELGADIAIGTSQRFGVPMGGRWSTRGLPGDARPSTRARCRDGLIGVSRDVHGSARPSHGRCRPASSTSSRERATSNICTAQVLLAIMASMYAVYHGPEGPDARSPAACTADTQRWPRALRRAGTRRSSPTVHPVLRHAPRDRPSTFTARRDPLTAADRRTDQPPGSSTTAASASPSTRPRRGEDVLDGCSRLFAREAGVRIAAVGGGRTRRVRPTVEYAEARSPAPVGLT